MYNPLPPLTIGLLNAEIAKGKRYYVRQFYARGMAATLRAAFLVRAYEENESALAEQHFASLTANPNRFLYDVQNPEHKESLVIAAGQPPGYKIFYAGSKGTAWKPPDAFQQKIRRYIQSRHSGWRTKKDGPKIEIGLCEEFGRLYLELSFGDDRDRVTLEIIENC